MDMLNYVDRLIFKSYLGMGLRFFQLGWNITKSSFMKLVCAALCFALIFCVYLINSYLSLR